MSYSRQKLAESYEDEYLSLDRELENGEISQQEYDKYVRILNQQYKQDLADLKD